MIFSCIYRKFPKYLDTTQKFYCNHSKIWTTWLYHRVMSPNDADGMANSVDLLLEEQSDLGLHYLPRRICPKTYLYSLRYILQLSTNYSMIKPYCSNFWIITATVSDCVRTQILPYIPIFRLYLRNAHPHLIYESPPVSLRMCSI